MKEPQVPPTCSEMVKEFHEKQRLLSCDLMYSGDDIVIPEIHERILVMQEEWHEVINALLMGNKEDIAHELADLIYTIVGTALTFGIEIEPVFAAVHKSNMTKGPGFDKTNYVKPEIKV